MLEVAGISFKKNGQVYYFLKHKFDVKENSNVIVETEHGLQYGIVVKPSIKISENKIKSPLKSIVRIADREDTKANEKNIKDARIALENARKIAEKLDMKIYLIDAMYTLDRDKLLFRFLSDSRVDFRNLARELASRYKTRIELRQIGARDKAKEVGGCGQCGRKLCCSSFLNNMDSVSVNMAKNQNVSLNPNKINGLCGRLLCCLTYEDETYRMCKKNLPSIGQTVKTDKGEGKVISVDILKQSYKVEVENSIVEVEKTHESS